MIQLDKWKPCLYCGKLIRNYPERKYCSFKCKHLDKQYWKNREDKSIIKWGATHYLKSEKGKEITKYIRVKNAKKAIELQKQQYNGKYRFQTKEFKEYCKQLSLEKRGVDHIFKSEEFRKSIESKRLKSFKITFAKKSAEQKAKENKERSITCKEKFHLKTKEQIKQIYNKVAKKKKLYWKNLTQYERNEICSKLSKAASNNANKRTLDQKNQFIRKCYETKKKNGTLGGPRSKAEIRCYEKLLTKFPNAKHSYYEDPRYPFNCDMYIPSQDLSIECHFSQYHHFKPFDENCIGDLAELSRLKNKLNDEYVTKKQKDKINSIITTWTKRDLLKLKTFQDNKLNYKIFYNEKEFDNWFTSL